MVAPGETNPALKHGAIIISSANADFESISLCQIDAGVIVLDDRVVFYSHFG